MLRSRFFAPAVASALALALFVLPVPAIAQTSSDPLGHEPGVKQGTLSITPEEFREQLEWWAADARGGREPGTPGNIEAGDVAVKEFERLGLEPRGDVTGGQRTYFQHFDRGGKYGFKREECRLVIGQHTFALGPDYTIAGWDAETDYHDLEVVFAGYGIRSKKLDYNDWEKAGAKDRAVLIFTHEPQETEPKSRWNGTRRTPDASIFRKLREARRQGARLILMVDGPLHHDPATDPLQPNEKFRARRCPVLHIRGRVAEALLEGTGQTLRSLQQAIDTDDRPHSMPLEPRLSFKAKRQLVRPARNILALYPGTDPKLKDEVVIIGAHYDHLGIGRYGSRARDRIGEIHNGADDNATGSVGVLELAEAFATSGVKTRRAILFILFDAEEKGLLGSYHWAENPTVPLEKVAAMINMDMIGHVTNNKMAISGVATARVWEKICKQAEFGSPLEWSHRPGAFGGSDHIAFLRKKIPVLMFNSGLHPYYHTPDDDASRCNPEGAAEVLKVLFRIAYETANLPHKPKWTEQRGRRPRITLGVSVEAVKPGAAIRRVVPGSPAARAGLKTGDVLVRVHRTKVRSGLSLRRALRRVRPGQSIRVEYLRGGRKKACTVAFPRPKAQDRKQQQKKKAA